MSVPSANLSDVELALKNKAIVGVYFWSESSDVSKQIAPLFEKYASMLPGAYFLKVNVDQVQGAREKYNVTTLPTTQFFEDEKLTRAVTGEDLDGLEDAFRNLGDE